MSLSEIALVQASIKNTVHFPVSTQQPLIRSASTRSTPDREHVAQRRVTVATRAECRNERVPLPVPAGDEAVGLPPAVLEDLLFSRIVDGELDDADLVGVDLHGAHGDTGPSEVGLITTDDQGGGNGFE